MLFQKLCVACKYTLCALYVPKCLRHNVIFSCIGTEHVRPHIIHLFDNTSEGDIKGFVLQHNSEVYKLLVQLSIFLIDLFVGTYRLSSHARLEAFVIHSTKKQN